MHSCGLKKMQTSKAANGSAFHTIALLPVVRFCGGSHL